MKKSAINHASEAPADCCRVRRIPKQRRSRERVERILGVAQELIAEKGIDAVRMNEVAERAEVPIGSLYQYFPDKASIVSTLASHYNAQGHACVQAQLETVTTDGELETALLNIVDGYYQQFLKEPVMRDIWRATQADKALQELDAADCEVHASMLFKTLKRLRPDYRQATLKTLSSLLMQQLAAAVRHAISLKKSQGDMAIAMFKGMLSAGLGDALEHGGGMKTRKDGIAKRSV